MACVCRDKHRRLWRNSQMPPSASHNPTPQSDNMSCALSCEWNASSIFPASVFTPTVTMRCRADRTSTMRLGISVSESSRIGKPELQASDAVIQWFYTEDMRLSQVASRHRRGDQDQINSLTLSDVRAYPDSQALPCIPRCSLLRARQVCPDIWAVSHICNSD